MADVAKRYYNPLLVEFGGEEHELLPIKGLSRQQEFERLVATQVDAMRAALVSGTVLKDFEPPQVDFATLLPRAAAWVTPELLAEASQPECMGLLIDACTINNLGHLTLFLDLGKMVDLALKLHVSSGGSTTPALPSPSLSVLSSEPESPGETSTGS